MNLDDIISLAVAAEVLGLSPDTLKRQAQLGRLDARVVGKTWITTKQEVERYRDEVQGRLGRPLQYTARMSKISWRVLAKYDSTIGDEGSMQEAVAMGLSEAKNAVEIPRRIEAYLDMIGLRMRVEHTDPVERLTTIRIVGPKDEPGHEPDPSDVT